MKYRCRSTVGTLAAVVSVTILACRDEGPAGPGACTIASPDVAVSATVGQIVPLSATARCERDPSPVVRWTSTAPGVVSVDSSTGHAVALTPGTAEIVAFVLGAPTTRASARVVVTVPKCVVPLNGLTVSPAQITVVPGGYGQIVATPPPTCGAQDTGGFVFTSADTRVATVDSVGLVKGLAPGSTVVRVALRSNTNVTASVIVSVSQPPGLIESFTVSPTAVTSGALDTARILAAVAFNPGAPAPSAAAASSARSAATSRRRRG